MKHATAIISYIAWRVGRNFTPTYHLTRDNAYTLCGKRPDGLLSVWISSGTPPVEKQCRTCRSCLTREEQR